MYEEFDKTLLKLDEFLNWPYERMGMERPPKEQTAGEIIEGKLLELESMCRMRLCG